jgi:hypothetical protein
MACIWCARLGSNQQPMPSEGTIYDYEKVKIVKFEKVSGFWQ